MRQTLQASFICLCRQEDTSKRKRIHYRHSLAEKTGLPAESVDVVSVCFVIHECPVSAIEGIIKEAKRLLVPGGRLLIEDNNPAYALTPFYSFVQTDLHEQSVNSGEC